MATAFQQSAFQNPVVGLHQGFQVDQAAIQEANPFGSLSVDQTVQFLTDQFEITYLSAKTFLARSKVDSTEVFIGLIDATGQPNLVKHITAGIVDEYEIHLTHQQLTGTMRGRDAGALAADTALFITYICGGVDWRTFNPVPDEALPPGLQKIPGVTSRIYLPGSWRASTLCTDLAKRVGLNCSYQATDYTLREDVEVSGPILGAIQQMIAPFCQFEPFKIDIYIEGKMLMIRQRQGLAEAPKPGGPVVDPMNVFSVYDARMLDFMLRAHYLDYIRTVRLTGAPYGDCEGAIIEVHTDETTSGEGDDSVSTRIVETRTIRTPDNAELSSVKETYTTDSDGTMRLSERANKNSVWDGLLFDKNCKLLRQAFQRSSQTHIDVLDPDDKTMGPGGRTTIRYIYDVLGFLAAEESLFETFNKDDNVFEDSKKEVKTYRDDGLKGYKCITTTFEATSDGMKFSSQRTSSASGSRPGGPGRGPASNSVDVPHYFKVGIVDNVPGAKDFSYNNDNLLQAHLQEIFDQAKASSGAWEYEMNFIMVNVPWLRKGQMLKLTGMVAEDGTTPIPLQAALITEIKTEYIETGPNPTSLQTVKAVWWSKF